MGKKEGEQNGFGAAQTPAAERLTAINQSIVTKWGGGGREVSERFLFAAKCACVAALVCRRRRRLLFLGVRMPPRRETFYIGFLAAVLSC